MSSEDGQAPPPKRVKTEKDDCDEAPFFTNDEGNSYFSIGGNRRCTIRKWKKQIFIDVREYYDKDGKELPGRKGISFAEKDYNTFNDLITGGKIDEQVTALNNYDENTRNKASLNEDGEPIFDLSSTKRCTVRKWKGSILIDLREFYEKNGMKLPGKKGISITSDQFQILRDFCADGKIAKEIKKLGGGESSDASVAKKDEPANQIKDESASIVAKEENDVKSENDSKIETSTAQKNDDGDPFFDLLSNKRCTIRKWKNKVLVDIREFYEKNDKKLPGKKGISLSEDQFKKLRELVLANSIHNQILLKDGEDVKMEEGKFEFKKNDDGDPFFELSSDKRCTIRSWKGRILIDIRQTYEKAGKVMPGRQGISLTKEQFKVFHDLVSDGTIDQHFKAQGGTI